MSENGGDGERIRPARRWSESTEVSERAGSLDDELRTVASATSRRRSRIPSLLARRLAPLLLALGTLVTSAVAAISIDLPAPTGPQSADVSGIDAEEITDAADSQDPQGAYAPTFDDLGDQDRPTRVRFPRTRASVPVNRPRATNETLFVAPEPVVAPAGSQSSREKRTDERAEVSQKNRKAEEQPARREPPPPPEPTAPLMHLYKKKTGAHFFTVSDETKARRLKNGWTLLHLEGDCYTEELPGSVALYQDEGIVCFALGEKTEVTTRALRLFTDADGDVVFTTKFDAETWSGSWTSEGVAGYVG